MEPENFIMPAAQLVDENVILDVLKPNDFELLYRVASDPLIWEQHPNNDRWKREVFQSYFNLAIESKTAFLIRDKRTLKIIGCSRFYDYKIDVSSLAIGFTFLSREFWGGKFNQSVKKLMINYAFRFVNVVIFHVGSTNIRSQKAVLKIGGKKINELATDVNGNELINFEYEIKKTNWED